MGLLQSILDFVVGLFMMAIGFYILKICAIPIHGPNVDMPLVTDVIDGGGGAV